MAPQEVTATSVFMFVLFKLWVRTNIKINTILGGFTGGASGNYIHVRLRAQVAWATLHDFTLLDLCVPSVHSLPILSDDSP